MFAAEGPILLFGHHRGSQCVHEYEIVCVGAFVCVRMLTNDLYVSHDSFIHGTQLMMCVCVCVCVCVCACR